MAVVGRLMAAGSCIKGLAFDFHGAHAWFRDVLLGTLALVSQRELSEAEWFSELQFESLPNHHLPRLPCRICKHRGEAIWPLQGPCAWPGFILFQKCSDMFKIFQDCSGSV